MNKIVKTISTTMVICAVVVSAFNAPIISVAHAQTTSGFGFDLPDFNFPDLNLGTGATDQSTTQTASTIVMQSCDVEVNKTTVASGGTVTLSWETSGFDVFTLNGNALNTPDGSLQMNNILEDTTYTLMARTADNTADCVASVTVDCLPPPPVDCRLEVTKVVDKSTAHVGDTLTYTITVRNTGNGDCTGSGVKIEDVVNEKLTYLTHTISGNITSGYEGTPVYTASDRTLHFNGNVLTPGEQGTITWTGRVNTPVSCGDFEIPNQAKATAFELNNFNTWVYSQTVKTIVDNDCVGNPAPSCDTFTANPTSITVGGNATLAWQTSHASRVVINNGIGEVALDGSVSVSPLTTTNYQLTAFGTEGRSVNCSVPVTVTTTNTAPICEYFTATPNSFGVGGGQVNLSWKVLNATSVSISPTIGSVSSQGSQTTNVTGSTNFVLTATDADGEQTTCPAPVTVAETPVFTCQNNVTFTASDYSINRGNDTVLSWNVTNADSVSISSLGSVTSSGSKSVEPSSDTTYTLTAKKGNQSVDCPLSVNVSSGGGGGGGTPTPRCELSISDNKIKAGDQITLKWNTSNANEVTIKDNRGKTIMSTEKYLSKDKDEYYDGSIKLKPTRDTEYTLTAERGSKDRTCKVKVDVDDLTVLTDRKPLVAGISLSNVPYTGFEAGPALTIFFYTLLALWALFVTYLIVVRPRMATGVSGGIIAESIPASVVAMKQAEAIRPDLFVPSIVATTATVPANLPTGTPVIGYENVSEATVHQVTDATVTALENRAHSQKALLSSDAVRHFIATTEGTVERNEALDEVIAEAKSLYPLEDGWIVINEARMRSLCDTCVANQTASQTAPYIPAVVPAGSSSLAEAIVTGNIVAAYEMIGNRPMFALADAAADFDSIVRSRRGEAVKVSNLLTTETVALSDEKLKNMISALTGALDGTYTDEASAVKMAIMKAVKEVA
ncbi:MAG: DUF11 domain-containing protein [Candidatus Pacebacteria bacterium]|nr:DUF11 domain-containing protein [Candidatus Paceibacterota bacterium]